MSAIATSAFVRGLTVVTLGSLIAMPAFAQQAAPPAKIDSGDTAWMIVATAFVLLMSLPGLALFYAGMVRKKNVLATTAQTLATAALVTVLWVVLGYSLTFSGSGAWIGDFGRFLMSGLTVEAIHPNAKTIPESVFAFYQMTFAIITPALVLGAVADRMKFSAMLWFMGLWLLVVYVPLAHWVWGGGFLQTDGVLDFAGGIVVHINAGIAGLVAAIVLGPRRNYGHENMAPYNLVLAVIGVSLLWVGWMGFNGGSALAADGRAGMAMLVTHVAAATAALAWMIAEWLTMGKPSVLGIISGAVAGLGSITPAAGYVGIGPALLIGLVAGVLCFYASTALKKRLGYDDSLDVFGVHGVGGIIGTIGAGIFAASFIAGPDIKGLWFDGNGKQVLTQLKGIVVCLVWSGALTWVILMILKATVGLRVNNEQEIEGLDLHLHGERVE